MERQREQELANEKAARDVLNDQLFDLKRSVMEGTGQEVVVRQLNEEVRLLREANLALEKEKVCPKVVVHRFLSMPSSVLH